MLCFKRKKKCINTLFAPLILHILFYFLIFLIPIQYVNILKSQPFISNQNSQSQIFQNEIVLDIKTCNVTFSKHMKSLINVTVKFVTCNACIVS